MRKSLQALPVVLTLLRPVAFLNCPADSPSNPFGGVSTGGSGRTTNLPTIVLTASRFDVNANGSDTSLVTATARNADRQPFQNQQILWTVTGQNFNGSPG